MANKVPVSVFQRENYILLDGERRWRCALKLNLKTIQHWFRTNPIHSQSAAVFNIHALREQWDLLTIAMKCPASLSCSRNN